MSLSRRRFLEVSALSATAVALQPGAVAEPTPDSVPVPGPDSTGRSPECARLDISLDHDWEFFRPGPEDGMPSPEPLPGAGGRSPAPVRWEAATLPHSVRLEPRDVSGGLNYQGVSWYRRRLPAEPGWRDRVVYLRFQGAMQVAGVWINGAHLTTHYGGYHPFTVDLSKALRYGGENELLVRLDNSDQSQVPPGKPERRLDFVYFGGLYRSVQLTVVDRLHISDPILADRPGGGGVFVTFPSVSETEAQVRVETEIVNEGSGAGSATLSQELISEAGEVVAAARRELRIGAGAAHTAVDTLLVRSPRLWHPDHPSLYRLRTVLASGGEIRDRQETRIGIRSIRFDPDRGLLINHEPFFSVGANRHQDHPYVGYALPPSAHYRDAYKLREAGFTSFRSHYPQDPSFMDACDELGILAIVSNPGWQFMGDDLFRRRVCQGAREMIRRDRNRPSVVIWEAQLNETDNSPLAAELYRIVHEEYPGPECYTAGDVVSRPAAGFSGWDVNYLGRGPGEQGRPRWIREWGDQVDNWGDQQGRVRVARGWGETPMLVQAAGHMGSLERIYATAPLPAGADLWAGVDAYRGYHHQPFLGGPLDLFRLPKFDYYMFQSQRPAARTAAPAGSGPMVFIASFATFHSPETVTVFSNCEEVRLFQNGRQVGVNRPDPGYHLPHPPFTFRVGDFSSTRSMLFAGGVAPAGTEIGELRAEGLIGGEVAATHVVRSPGVPDHLELAVDTCGRAPVADGADWVRVYAHVADTRGTTHPYADDMVTFRVTGEGSVLEAAGIGANPVRAEAGIATALVRMTRAAGAVEVRASAPGLGDGVARFLSRPA